MHTEIRRGLPLLAALLVAGCAVGPDHRLPQTALPERFAGQAGYAAERVTPAFWAAFDDAQLSALVDRALAENHDLRVAEARLAEVRALRREARLDYAPTVTAAATWQRTRLSRTEVAAGADREPSGYDAGFDATWELDLFGRVRRSVEARDAEVGSAIAARRAVAVAVTGEVARQYFELRGLQLRLAVAQRNLENQRETLALTTTRLEAGRGTELDVARARAQLESTAASLPALDTQLVAARHRLAVLTGQPPAALDAQLAVPERLPALPQLVAVGTPADWLRRRPDVAQAERQLAAATARVGVAVADLFPRVGFTGYVGSTATDVDALGDGGTYTHTLLPGLRWAAFDLGRVRAQIAASEAAAERRLAEYERTVLVALEETENALAGYRNAVQRERSLAAAARDSLRATTLARIRFDEGVADFLTVLDAERTQLEAEDRLASAQADSAARLVAVYKALGAGWEPAEAVPVRRVPVP